MALKLIKKARQKDDRMQGNVHPQEQAAMKTHNKSLEHKTQPSVTTFFRPRQSNKDSGETAMTPLTNSAHGTYALSVSLSISLSLDHQYLLSFRHAVCFPLISPPRSAPVYTLINESFSHVVADARLSMPSRARRTLARRRTRRRWASTRFSRPAIHSQHHLSNRQ